MRLRVQGLLEKDALRAATVLRDIGIDPKQLTAHLQRIGLAFRARSKKVPELHDPAHPAFAAARLLMLRDELLAADPECLQLGRVWGFLAKGLAIEGIAKASRDHLLTKARGRGGRRQTDLGRSLRAIAEERPDIKLDQLPGFVASDEGRDMAGDILGARILISDLQFSQNCLLYLDARGREMKVSVLSLARQLQRIKASAT